MINNNNNNRAVDDNKNYIAYEKCPRGIKTVFVTCETETETHLNLLASQNEIENYEFLNNLKYNKRVWKVPWFILIMCCLQISLFVIANGCVRQYLIFMPDTINQYWRYFTYMLLHSDILHLSMNVCLQFVIGFCLESEQGHLKVACVYIIGGISGSLATLYLQPQLSLLGASAGVYAMLMSHIPHLLKNFHHLPHRYLRIIALVILFTSDVCFTTFHVLINHNTNPRFCLEAHLAGAISGLIFGFLLYRTSSKSGSSLSSSPPSPLSPKISTLSKRSERCGQNV